MRIIHVLRKPFTGPVASNVLEHGCGALHIDATRIAFKGEQSPSVERRDAAARTGKAGRVTSALRVGEGRFAAGQDVEQALASYVEPRTGEFKGRWPANVILEHTERCGIVGGEKSKVIETQTLGDADGLDRSDLWECGQGCPAADLDEDLGMLTIGGGVRNSAKRRVFGDGGFPGGEPPRSSPSNKGGASRFFFQFMGHKG